MKSIAANSSTTIQDSSPNPESSKNFEQIQVLTNVKVKKIKSCETSPKLLKLDHHKRVAAIEPHVPGPGLK